MDYDWDSIVAGDPILNSSQNFFRVRHTLHEKVGCKIKDVQIINEESEKGVKKALRDTDPKRRPPSNDKENVQNNAARANVAVSLVAKKQTGETQQNIIKHSVLKNVLKKSLSVTAGPAALAQKSNPDEKQTNKTQHNITKPLVLKNFLKKSLSVNVRPSALTQKSHPDKKQTNETQQNMTKPPVKKVLKKSISIPTALAQKSRPVVQGASAFKKPPTNIGERQYAYAETIQKRKEELAKRVKQMEEKELKFKFRAKEAPKIHQKKIAAADRSITDKKTIPKQNSLPTMTLTRKAPKSLSGFPSCGDPDKLKIVQAKRQAMSNYKETPAPFKAKPAAVLTKQPFQPIIHAKAVVDQKPFRLQLTDRLVQRSEFDKKLHEKIAKRKEHEENLSRQQELETRKLIRQKTEFKARPNPFGCH